MAFPDTRDLGTQVELLLGEVWTAITPDIRLGQTITITRGRQDYASRVDPTNVTAAINNADGTYSPRNPVGPYYGQLTRNTQMRVSVAPADVPWLDVAPGTTRRATTPDHAALHITGDIDVRVEGALTLWGDRRGDVELINRWDNAGGGSWILLVTGYGNLQLSWSPDGTTTRVAGSTVPVTASPRQRLALRVTLDVDNGAGGYTVTFYTAASLSGPWTQLGDQVVGAGPTSIFTGSLPLGIGAVAPAFGKRFYAAEVRSSINGTVVASPAFETLTTGATGWTDSAGRAWTASAGAITNRDVRAQVEVPAWPPRWAADGRVVVTEVEGAGILRRLGQGSSPLASTLRRRIPSDANLLAYWPMEDQTTSSRIASAMPGGRSMAASGLTYASEDSLAGSTALPVVSSGGGTLSGTVPAGRPLSSGWRVECVFKLPSMPASAATMLQVQTTAGRVVSVIVGPNLSRIQVAQADGTVLATNDTTAPHFNDGWTRLQIIGRQNGTAVDFTVVWVVIGGTFSAAHTASIAGGALIGHVARVSAVWGGSDFSGMALGHLAAFDVADTQIFDNADKGFEDETVGARLVRLSGEEGVALGVQAPARGDGPLGAQRTDTLLGVLQDAVDADSGGILFEARDEVALRARSRWTLYNQTPKLVLHYTGGLHEVAPPLEPQDDDQDIRNDVTVQRTGGSSARATLDSGPNSVLAPPAGVGRYDDSITLNLDTDDQTTQHAGWRLHLGTYDGIRYPAVTVNLARAPHLIAAASAVEIGDRIQVLNPPPWLPPDPIDLIVQGITEAIGVWTWSMTFQCTPAGPWTVGTVGDSVLGRVRSGTSTLAAAVTATDTTLPVTSSGIALWTTDPSRYPYDLLLGGERVAATACGTWVSDSFTRTVASGWGTATSGQTWTTSGGSASDYSTSGTTGRHSLGSVNVARSTLIGAAIPDADLAVSVSTSALAAGGNQQVYVLARRADDSNYVCARLDYTTSAGVTLTLRKKIAGSETILATKITSLTHVAGTLYRVRLQAIGADFQAKVWVASGVEPKGWDLATTDSSVTAAGQIGVRSILATGNTNTLPVTVTFDDFTLITPQAFTVTRSVNGVSKSQTAGTAVDLLTPMTIPL